MTAKSTNPEEQKPQQSPRQEEHSASKHEAPTGVQSVEPHDSQVTGAGKSHLRRLLDLNVDDQGGQAQQHPATPAGQHATGSFTNDPDLDSRQKDK